MAVSEVGECQVKFTQTFFKSLNDIMASAEEKFQGGGGRLDKSFEAAGFAKVFGRIASKRL